MGPLPGPWEGNTDGVIVSVAPARAVPVKVAVGKGAAALGEDEGLTVPLTVREGLGVRVGSAVGLADTVSEGVSEAVFEAVRLALRLGLASAVGLSL